MIPSLLLVVVSRPDPTPPQPTNEGYHFEEFYNPEPEVALPEGVYVTPSNPRPTQSEPAVHEVRRWIMVCVCVCV